MKYENFQIKPEKIPIWFAKLKNKNKLAVFSKRFSGYNIKTFQKTEPAKTRQVQSYNLQILKVVF